MHRPLRTLSTMHRHRTPSIIPRLRDRTPKSSKQWTSTELLAYNITVVDQEKEEFFETTDFPDPVEPSLAALMTADTEGYAADKKTRQLVQYLNLAKFSGFGQESAVVNLAAELLKCFNYDVGNRIVFTGHGFPFQICGKNRYAYTDACIMDADEQILLLLQGDHKGWGTEMEGQIIAQAIAAFQRNNEIRDCDFDLPPHHSFTFPSIIMTGPSPTFYKTTVTNALNDAVELGNYPKAETRVFRYIPGPPPRDHDGLYSQKNRPEIMQCFEAFKRFLGN